MEALGEVLTSDDGEANNCPFLSQYRGRVGYINQQKSDCGKTFGEISFSALLDKNII